MPHLSVTFEWLDVRGAATGAICAGFDEEKAAGAAVEVLVELADWLADTRG